MFIPMVLGLWLIVGGMSWWQVYRVRQSRIDIIYDQLKFVTDHMVDLSGNKTEFNAFITYINSFYSNDENYDDITIKSKDTVTGKVKTYTGPSIYVPFDRLKYDHGEFRSVDPEGVTHTYIYYRETIRDGKLVIVSMLPLTGKVARSVSPITIRFWLIMISIGLFSTLMAYISTEYVVSNIAFLREFTRRAARREDFDISAVDELPDDQLGDISRDIVEIYARLTEEMARSEQEHKVALNAIEEKTRIKRELTANINHEIKTPIGIIKGYVDTILADPDMPEDIKHRFLVKIQENVDRLTELIADISVITKYEHGDKLVAISDINFHDLVFTFADELKIAEKGEAEMPFTFDVPLGCVISGNEALLRAMLANLVRNARAYSQGTMCRLEYEREDDDFYYFSFYDDGVGVPPEAIPRLFERFYRLNQGRARNAGGTGLGLPIVKVTIESFGGKIEVDNRIPSGLIFRFSLARYKEREA